MSENQTVPLAPPEETLKQKVDLQPAPTKTTATTIPVLGPGEPLTEEYVKLLDIAIQSDGCTGVKDYYRPCCVIHDLAYRAQVDPWGNAVTKAQADTNFRNCIQGRSRFGRYSPMAWVRYTGLRLFGRFFYHPIKP